MAPRRRARRHGALPALPPRSIDVYYLYNTCDDPAAKRALRAPVGQKSMLSRVFDAQAARAKAKSEEKAARAKAGIADDAVAVASDPNCFGSGPTLEAYFNAPGAADAFHVSTDITWSLCSNNGTFNYNSDIADERTTIYPTLTKKAGYQVLICQCEGAGGRGGRARERAKTRDVSKHMRLGALADPPLV